MSVAGFEARSVADAALLISVGAADDDLRDALSARRERLRVARLDEARRSHARARRREARRGRDGRPAPLARPRGRAERPALPAAERPRPSAISPASPRTWTSATSVPSGSSAAPRASPAWATRSRGRCSTGRCARTTPRADAALLRTPRRAAHAGQRACRRCEPGSGRGSARSAPARDGAGLSVRGRVEPDRPAVHLGAGGTSDGPPDRHAARGPPRRGGHPARARRAARGRAALDRASAASPPE